MYISNDIPLRKTFSFYIDHGDIDSRTIDTARKMEEKGIDMKTISDILEIEENDLKYVLAAE